jgi:hypothetical protein
MKHVSMFFLILVWIFVGCESTMVSDTDDAGVLADANTSMSSAKTVKMVPFKGTFSGTGGFDETRTDCPDGSVPISGVGYGTASHLGQIETYFSHCSYFLVDPTNPTYVDGHGIMTAANGDQLFGMYHGQLTGPDTFINYNTLVDGTGRFENISGMITEFGTVALNDEGGFEFEIHFEGVISSVGSGK